MGKVIKVEFKDSPDAVIGGPAVLCYLAGKGFRSIQHMRAWVESVNNALILYDRKQEDESDDT